MDAVAQLWSDVRVLIIKATLDEHHPLSLLRDQSILHKIFDRVHSWLQAIQHTDRAFHLVCEDDMFGEKTPVELLSFPTPTGININLMPIKLMDFHTIPPEIADGYSHFFEAVRRLSPESWRDDCVMYLTINESMVDANSTQRRAGLHIERPGGFASDGGKLTKREIDIARFGEGIFVTTSEVEGGIYMASNRSNSCAIWPVLITDPAAMADRHGGIEHLRSYLGAPQHLRAGELCWFSDRTPHESLPDMVSQHRSFFRLVVGKLSVWYSKHSTANPCGLLPDAPISDSDKFEVVT